jgi:hypothetical protein
MDDQQAREQLLAELQRHGLPRNYIQRLLDELDDHLADLQDERNSDMNTARKPDLNQTDSKASESSSPDIVNLQDRLGDPTQLAAFASKQYHNRSFLGRHPIFTFVAAPIPVMILSWTVPLVVLTAIEMTWNHFWPAGDYNPREYLRSQTIGIVLWTWSYMVFLPLINVLFMCRVARRNSLEWRWARIAMVLLALLCADFWVTGIFPTNDHYIPDSLGNGGMMLGFSFPASLYALFLYTLRFALAMGIGLLLIKRAQQLQKIDENRAEATVLRRAA